MVLIVTIAGKSNLQRKETDSWEGMKYKVRAEDAKVGEVINEAEV